MLKNFVLTSILLEAGLVSGFPHIAAQWAEQNNRELVTKRQSTPTVPFPEFPGSPAHATYNSFDPVMQKVSTSGTHKWIAPGPGDIRGPCAGLNAAANHGYLPRNGIATYETINSGLWEAFGLDQTATQFLETATRFFDGDPTTGRWSIGYYSDQTQSLGAVGDMLGNETGICAYGHLKTEGDASITRGDWLAPKQNSNCASYPTFAQELLDLAKRMTGGNLTPQVMAQHQYNRKQHSIATNPNYFAPAYAGVAFTFGAHMFAYELLANHSAENPRGILTPEVFESFFSYKRDSAGKLVYTYGHERIPDNWYRRADDDAWTLDDIVISTAQQCASYPSNCQVGGNVGKVNNFVGVDPGDISGGLLDGWGALTDPTTMGCFIRQAIQADVPAFLDKVFTPAALVPILALIPTTLTPALEGLGSCPNLPAGRSQVEYGSAYGGAKYRTTGNRKPYPGYNSGS